MTHVSGGAVLVCGASGAIGKALCDRFSSDGYRVVAAARSEQKNEGSSVRSALLFDPLAPVDSHPLLAPFAPFEAVVFAQGANVNDSLYDLDMERHRSLYEANVLYVVATLKLLLDGNLLARPARICIISSIWQNLARQNKFSYCVTKSALQGLVLSASVDLARDGHLVNAVLPGVLDTPMTRANLKPEQVRGVECATAFERLPSLDDVTNLVLYLCSPSNTGITGQFITADLGFTHARII